MKLVLLIFLASKLILSYPEYYQIVRSNFGEGMTKKSERQIVRTLSELASKDSLFERRLETCEMEIEDLT